MPTYEVYTTGGGYYVLDMMNYLAMFTSGNMFADMLVVGIIVGVLFATIRMVLTGNMQGTMQYIVMVAVVGAFGIGPKARVIVMDSTYPLEIYGAADNVPFSVAVVAHYTSSASYHITRRMETLLSTPSNLTYQRHGMLFGATLMSQAARWRAITPTIHNNLVNFMENCMIDGTNVGLVDLNELARTGFLDTYVGNSAPGALAYYDEASGNTVRCSDGWAGLESQMDAEVQRVFKVKAAAIAQATGSPLAVPDIGGLTGTLDDFQNMMGMAGYDATRYLKQSMLIQALDDSVLRLVGNSGNSAAMTLYQSARAEQQTRSSYQAVGMNATKWVPLIKITFEVLYYGAFPLALLLMMTPLSLAVVKGYFSGFVWLAAWEPLSAILHTTMIKASEGYYGDSTGTLVGNNVENVLSWANHMGVQAVEQEVGATAGYLMMSIPFLSFAIFFGAQKMAGMATSMLNVSQGAAIDTGREAATGNVSLGNTSMHNMSANKWNTSHVRDEGRYTEALSDGTMLMRNQDGSQTYGTGSAQSSTGFAANIGQTVRSEISERLSDSQRAVESHSSDFSQSISNASAQVSDFARTASDTRTAGGGVSATMSEDTKTSVADSWKKIEDFAQSNGMSTDMALKAAITAGTPGAKIFGLTGTGDMSASEAERFNKAINSSEMSELSSAASTIVSAAERTFSDSNSSEGQNAANTLRSTLDNVQSSASRLSNSYEQTSALERANALVQSNEGGSRTNITDAFLGKVQAAGYSPQQIGQIFNGKSAAAIQKQQELIDEHMPSLLRELGVNTSGVGSGPDMSGVRNEPLPMRHQPIDTQAASNQLATPQVGNYAGRDAQARGIYGDNVDKALDRVGADGTRIQQDADTHRHSVEEGTDRGLVKTFGRHTGDTAGELVSLGKEIGTALSWGGGGNVPVMRAGFMGGGGSPSGGSIMGSGAPQSGMLSSFALNTMPAQSGAGPAGALSMRIRPSGVDEGMATSSHGAIDHRGFYQAPNIDYAISDATIRDKPVQPAIMARLSGIVGEMGRDLGIVVTSGGQPSSGPDRTGSHRHDDGNSVDFYLTQNGQRVNPGDDKELYAKFIENSSGYFDGMGHYSWGMHVGGGGAAFWGPDKTAATADPQFLDAYQRGRS